MFRIIVFIFYGYQCYPIRKKSSKEPLKLDSYDKLETAIVMNENLRLFYMGY